MIYLMAYLLDRLLNKWVRLIYSKKNWIYNDKIHLFDKKLLFELAY